MLTRAEAQLQKQRTSHDCGMQGLLAATHQMLGISPLLSDALAAHISALPAKQSQEFPAALKSATHMLT